MDNELKKKYGLPTALFVFDSEVGKLFKDFDKWQKHDRC